MSQPGFEPPTSCTAGGNSSKELLQQLIQLTIRILNNIVLYVASQEILEMQGDFCNSSVASGSFYISIFELKRLQSSTLFLGLLLALTFCC
jgi:hypothetical protein